MGLELVQLADAVADVEQLQVQLVKLQADTSWQMAIVIDQREDL
jgi:hypothetical protein